MQHLEKQRQRYPGIEIETWGEPELLKLNDRLDLAALKDIFGPALSQDDIKALAIADLAPIIEGLERAEHSHRPVRAPSAHKLSKDDLSADAAPLLRVGCRKEGLIALLLPSFRRPDLEEQIADVFRNRFQKLPAAACLPMRSSWS